MGRGLRGVLAGAGALAAVALFAPASAVAHPCAGANAKVASSFLSVNSATWVGMRPVHVEHECSGEGGAVTSTAAKAAAAGVTIADDPTFEQMVSEFEFTPNMTPVGYAANVIPYLPAPYNSDLAFQGNYAFMGTNDGFVVYRRHEPGEPAEGPPQQELHDLAGRRRRLQEHPRPLVGLADQRQRRRDAVLRRHARRPGLRGRPHLRHHRPDEPGDGRRRQHPRGKQGLRFSTQDMPRKGCGSHTATAVPDETRGNLYIYNGGSSGTCTWMDVLKIKMSDPTDAAYVKQAPSGRSCHDNTVFLNGANSLRVLRGRQRHHDVQVRRHDRPDAAGRHREPDPDVVAAAGRRHRPLGRVQLRRQDGRRSAMSRAAASRRTARPRARP